jgi:hypothetical protein
VAVIRLKNVASDIAFARILLAKTSDGTSHAPGPIPTLKKERYNESPTIANIELFFSPKKEKLVKIQAPDIPWYENENLIENNVYQNKLPQREILTDKRNEKERSAT